jgi:myo-inositol-1(or 4)-monophosphatase
MRDYRSFLETVLRSAGKLIMARRGAADPISNKEKNEIVTQADIISNEYITSEFLKAFPEIPIYTEEQVDHKSQAKSRWIVDPLDGTTAWAWGNSGFSISVALEEDGIVTVGAVYDPVMEELFYAETGKGATRNGQAIHAAAGVPVKEMLVVVDWGNKDDKREEGMAYFRRFMLPEMFARRVVPQWAPALGLCRIAEGRVHALVCNDTWPDDHAAGALILTEAGGHVSNFYHHTGFKTRESGIIAANEKTAHQAIVDFLQAGKT